MKLWPHWVLIWTLVGLVCLVGRAVAAPSSLINIFESRFGTPGTPHVVPECGCTFRYVGTRVDGMDYFVHFKKLD